jgi:hypothetical protein
MSSASYRTKVEPACAHHTRFSSTEAANCRENTPSRTNTTSPIHHARHTENLSSPTSSSGCLLDQAPLPLLVHHHTPQLSCTPSGALAKQRPVFQHRRYLTDSRSRTSTDLPILALATQSFLVFTSLKSHRAALLYIFLSLSLSLSLSLCVCVCVCY